MNGFVQPFLPGVICFFHSIAVEEFRKIIPEFEENLLSFQGGGWATSEYARRAVDSPILAVSCTQVVNFTTCNTVKGLLLVEVEGALEP